MAVDEEDDVATASLLLNCAGVQRQVFPKTYNIRLSRGFAAYLVFLTFFVFSYTIVLYYTPERGPESGGISFEQLLLFDVAYSCITLFIILLQVPRRVVRENDKLLIMFCCRTRSVLIESLIEIRVVRRQRCCQRRRGWLYPGKCFWGYPTNFERNIIVVSDSRCNNYFFCVHEMEDFMLDNWPAPDLPDGRGSKDPEPNVFGSGL
ncbi:unnamed protein product [Effrenium voratum]|nr:unnamed protein product [Effrenium voratum]